MGGWSATSGRVAGKEGNEPEAGRRRDHSQLFAGRYIYFYRMDRELTRVSYPALCQVGEAWPLKPQPRPLPGNPAREIGAAPATWPRRVGRRARAGTQGTGAAQ